MAETTAKINSLLEMSANAIACGPDCQKQKKAAEYKQAMLNAQTNVQMAPHLYDEAKKQYYMEVAGEDAWSAIQEKELQKQADMMGDKLTKVFDEGIAKAQALNGIYVANIGSVENTGDFYTLLHAKNAANVHDLHEDYADAITTDRRAAYESAANDRLSGWYYLMFWIYYGLVVLYVLCCLFVKTELSRIRQIVVGILLIIYPWIIHPIVKFCISWLLFLRTWLPAAV